MKNKNSTNSSSNLISEALKEILNVIFGDDGCKRIKTGDDIIAAKEAISIIHDLKIKLNDTEHRAKEWERKAINNDRWKGTKFPVVIRLRDLRITIDKD